MKEVAKNQRPPFINKNSGFPPNRVIEDTPIYIKYEIEVPGIPKDELIVALKQANGHVYISVEHHNKWGDSIQLPSGSVYVGASAHYHLGMLTVIVQKHQFKDSIPIHEKTDMNNDKFVYGHSVVSEDTVVDYDDYIQNEDGSWTHVTPPSSHIGTHVSNFKDVRRRRTATH